MNARSAYDVDAPTATLVDGLYWGVRGSFVEYILNGGDGLIHADGGVDTDGQGVFRFPVEAVQRDAAGWVLSFGGQLRFMAHFGALDVDLSRPRIELGATGQLIVDSHGAETVLARVEPAEPIEVDGWLVWPPLTTRLTLAGSVLFGGVYSEGDDLDVLRIAVVAPSRVDGRDY
ncbi:HtaA domain-containing protein [Microbacterium sp. A84]|uniref:HtaA domain-containing protein n=1 Tax=Microbacterium sp. A84 TaxID=3450715 RepID=UPI003F43F13E